MVTTNSSGSTGCCIPNDMCCEHKVRQAKDLFRSFNSQLETTLMDKAILSQNPIHIMKDHFFDSFGKGDLKTGGSHRHHHMSREETGIIREELKRMKMFEIGANRPVVTYNQNIRRVWESLDNDNIEAFLARNCKSYEKKENL